MKDLDFDELDRAVNSLIGSPSAPATTPVTPVATDSPAPIDIPAPVVAPVESANVVSSSLQPLAARRSSGRFMDVVHPSSDMRPTTMPDRPIAREGMTVQPVAIEPTPEAVAEDPITPEPTVPPKSSDWPDPLDFHGYKAEEATATEVSEQVVEQDKTVNMPSAPVSEPAAPLESPFLPDAKVEKRPLGAFADTAITLEPPVVEAVEPPSDDSDRPISTDTPLPAELQDSLLSIEANEDTALVSEEVTPSKPQSPVVETMSIPQQYVEQPSTGDKPATSSIFDVEAYHKPTAQPKKAKSGWMMVLWIVLLIILGVGAGAAFYFYVLPLL